MPVNESIIDAEGEVFRKDKYADVRLEKLERLGKNMCYSIVKKADEGTCSLNSSLKKVWYCMIPSRLKMDYKGNLKTFVKFLWYFYYHYLILL